MLLTLPDFCLVVLVGPSGSGKSTLARRLFRPTEILSSDAFRGLVADDENDQSATADAFDALRYVAAKRLSAGRLTVIDATNVRPEDRRPLVDLAREHDALAAAVVLRVRDEVCHDRNRGRPDRAFGPHVVRGQNATLRRGLRGLRREGFRYVHVLDGPEAIDAAAVERQRLWNDRRDDAGPFDVIGDVHGCHDELVELLGRLGYAVERDRGVPPPGRKAVFLGDLADRGPDSPGVLRLVMSMVAAGHALCVPGNHDVKLLRALRGANVQVAHGLAETLEQLAGEPDEFKAQVIEFLDGLIGHYVLDGGRLVVAHAGMKQRYVGRASARVREFALYGETTGEADDLGLPVRHDWAAEYRGPAAVAYGHTPVAEPQWLNGTINLDTGCVFGGRLSALRWPEREVVAVAARRAYAEPARPLVAIGPALKGGALGSFDTDASLGVATAQQAHDDVLDLADVTGKRGIETPLAGRVTVRAENAAAALEVMSRFAVDPRWLIYLPPTMSPCATSRREGLLEHPAEAFAYYRENGVSAVVCQEKHMGSRAVAIVCRDAATARRRFGVSGEQADRAGVVYTRTGRPFFSDAATESTVLGQLRDAASAAGLWDELGTDWIALDCELMPWSAKARDLLRDQYAAVGSAAGASLGRAVDLLRQAAARDGNGEGGELAALAERFAGRRAGVDAYVAAYRRYCWSVAGADDLRLAPFHLLAGEGATYLDRDHVWHMEVVGRLCEAASGSDRAGASDRAGRSDRAIRAACGFAMNDANRTVAPRAGGSILMRTRHVAVDLDDPASEAAATAWWEEMTAAGGEGMVVKPRSFVARSAGGRVVQPAVKCRGREYLRIIYGPEYAAPEHLDRLRSRGLGRKRALALREFALGAEALERFVRREPLRRVHECAFAVLAMESEPVDPRL